MEQIGEHYQKYNDWEKVQTKIDDMISGMQEVFHKAAETTTEEAAEASLSRSADAESPIDNAAFEVGVEDATDSPAVGSLPASSSPAGSSPETGSPTSCSFALSTPAESPMPPWAGGFAAVGWNQRLSGMPMCPLD
jgi:hypothetical protein